LDHVLLLIRFFMVIPEQMEHAMDSQKSEFPLQGMAVAYCLFLSFLNRYDNITQLDPVGIRVQISGLDVQYAMVVIKKRKGEHIGGDLDVPVFPIHLRDPVIIHQRN